MATRWLMVVSIFLTSSCFAEPLATVSLPPAIDKVLQDYRRAWEGKDMDSLLNLYTAEGIALPNGQAPAASPASIKEAYGKFLGTPLVLRPFAFGVSGDLAYVIGGYGEAGDKPEFGKFTVILKQAANGEWRIVSDMDNSNQPLTPPPETLNKQPQSAP